MAWKPKFNNEVRNTASEYQIHSYTLIIYDISLPILKVLDYYYYHVIVTNMVLLHYYIIILYYYIFQKTWYLFAKSSHSKITTVFKNHV